MAVVAAGTYLLARGLWAVSEFLLLLCFYLSYVGPEWRELSAGQRVERINWAEQIAPCFWAAAIFIPVGICLLLKGRSLLQTLPPTNGAAAAGIRSPDIADMNAEGEDS